MKKGWRKESKANPQMERGAFRSRNHGSSSLYWKGKRRKIEVCRRPISDNVCSSFLYGSQYLSCSQSGSPAFADEGVNYHFSCEYYRPKEISFTARFLKFVAIHFNRSEQFRSTEKDKFFSLTFSLSLAVKLKFWKFILSNIIIFFTSLCWFYDSKFLKTIVRYFEIFAILSALFSEEIFTATEYSGERVSAWVDKQCNAPSPASIKNSVYLQSP